MATSPAQACPVLTFFSLKNIYLLLSLLFVYVCDVCCVCRGRKTTPKESFIAFNCGLWVLKSGLVSKSFNVLRKISPGLNSFS